MGGGEQGAAKFGEDHSKKEEEKKSAVRYAEKRRTSTCRFADRIASISVEHYRRVLGDTADGGSPTADARGNGACCPPQWKCVATIVAHHSSNDDCVGSSNKCGPLRVLAMGVGTKFLQEAVLAEEEDAARTCYGKRVRDCHAEVLARRAFRRYLSLEMLRDVRQKRHISDDEEEEEEGADSSSPSPGDFFPILTRASNRENRTGDGQTNPRSRISYRLRSNVSLHFYCSSAPCGNSVLKKFVTPKRERFREDLGEDEWPMDRHEHVQGHSIHLGQFALLLKKDNSASGKTGIEGAPPSDGEIQQQQPPSKRSKASQSGKSRCKVKGEWPARTSDDWCPPGTTTVWNSANNRGSLHCCSDKLGRWNCLGLQGSLLASLLPPTHNVIHVSTLTVGRKFTADTCRRAVCCRLGEDEDDADGGISRVQPVASSPASATTVVRSKKVGRSRRRRKIGEVWKHPYRLNHPAVLGTSVYLDADCVIDMTNPGSFGQDIRFHSSKSWAWWAGTAAEDDGEGVLECIDGSTGYISSDNDDRKDLATSTDASSACPMPQISSISTFALTELYLEISRERLRADGGGDEPGDNAFGKSENPTTLPELMLFKWRYSTDYEQAKERLLTKHPVLCQWNRRQKNNDSQSIQSL